MLFNPQSINNNVNEVMDYVYDHNISILALCESWLADRNSPTTSIIKSRGFKIKHDFRSDRAGGGTAIIFKSCYSLHKVTLLGDFDTFEYTVVSLKCGSKNKILFLILYRTGNLTSHFIREFDNILSQVFALSDCVIVAGDLNIHFNKANSNKIIAQTVDIIDSYALQSHVSKSTHIKGGSLDKVFSFSLDRDLKFISCLVDSDSTLASDHFPVICTFKFDIQAKYFKTIQYRNIKGVKYDAFSQDLDDVISTHLSSTDNDLESAVNKFMNDSKSLVNHHAPMIRKTISIVDSAPWFDFEYKELRKERRKAERIWKKSKLTADKIAYKNLCSKCTIVASEKKKAYFTNFMSGISKNPRKIFSAVNKELDRNQAKCLPETLGDITEVATAFNKFFTEKVDKIRREIPIITSSNCTEHHFNGRYLYEFLPTTLEEIKSIINETGVKAAPDDLLPQSLLKKHIVKLLPVIVKLVNMSLSTGKMEGLKLADIIPLIKDEILDINVFNNYRPVSNLLFIGKIVERVVLRQLNEHMSKNLLHCPQQSAYKKGHSTETLLVRITNDLLMATDERSATVVMLLDLSAAFDTVDHDLLLKILENEIGLKGKVLTWFESFLKGRSQRIRIGHITSDVIFIKFGVPQGSVLGPVLFNIYIRSIYACVQKLGFGILGYADDHQILKVFTS